MTESTASASTAAPIRAPARSVSPARIARLLVGSYLVFAAATALLATVLAVSWLAAMDVVEQAAFAAVPLLCGVVLLVLATLAYRAQRAPGAGTAYTMLLASTGLAFVAVFDQASTRSLTWAWLIGLAMAGGAYLHLTALFPRESSLYRRVPGSPVGGYALAAAIASVALAMGSRGNPQASEAAALRLVLSWLLMAGSVYLIVVAVLAIKASSPVQRLQSRLLAGAMLLGLLPLLLALVMLPTQNFTFSSYLILPSIFPCLALGYSMFRFRVSGAAQWLRQGVIHGLLVALIMLAYGLVVAGLTLVFRTGVPSTSPLWVAALALAVALLLEPVRTRLQSTADRMFFRGDSALDATVRSFTADLSAANDSDAIAVVVRRVVSTALEPDSTHLFVYDQPADQYAAVRDASGRPTTEIRFGTDSPLPLLLSQTNTLLVLEEASLPSQLQSERSRLTLLGARMFIAFRGRERLLGWLALGPKKAGEPYSTGDIALLEQLGDQASAAVGRVHVVQSLERRIRDMNALTRVAQGVNITLTFDDVLELIYAQTAQIIPLTHFHITLHNPQTDSYSSAFALENNERASDRENIALPPRTGLEREVLRRGRPIITANYESECHSAGLTPATSGIRSWMGVPLNTGAVSIGVLSAGNREPGVTYTQAQLELLQAIADQTAGAIVKGRLLRETEQRATQLSKLNEVTRQLASTLDMTDLRQVIADGATGILGCEAAILYVPDQTTGALAVSAVAGAAAGTLVGQSAPVGVGHVFRAAASRATEIENELDLAAGTHVLVHGSSGWLPRSSMAVPLQFQDTLVGMLEVLNRRDGAAFVAEDESLLRAFAGQAVVALENVRLYTLTDQELTARVEELSVMQRIDRELNASLEMDRAMRITLEWALRQSNAEAGLIGLLANDRLRIVTEMGYGTSPGESSDQSVSLTFPGYQAAVDTALPQRVRFDIVGTGGFLPASDHQVVIPIRREAAVIGLLVLESTRSAQEDLGFLSRLSDHAAIAISNAQLYDEVQRANIAKSDFVSLVAHELKNPMTSIKGYTELLAAGAVGPVNEMQANFLNTIRSNTERMSTLVSDLNDNSKIEAGKLRLDFKAVELMELVDEILQSADRQIGEKKQQVGLELAEQLPSVWADRTRLGQVLTNLVSNANKYTAEGGTLVIGAEPSPNHWDPTGVGQVVHVWVRDSGIGISPQDQERIFEKFFRSEDPKAREVPGAGLGLNITRSLVEMQGGKIWFESQHRHGTTFHFTVPVAEA